jgi:hypothetical protein
MKKETLEEVAYQRAVDRLWHPNSLETRRVGYEIIEAVKFGANWQAERMFTADEMKEYATFCIRCYENNLPCLIPEDWDNILAQ